MATKTTVLGAAAIAAVLAAWFLWPRDPGARSADTAATPAPDVAAVAPPPPPRARPADEPPPPPVPEPSTEPFVRGRVVDATGRPAAGVEIWLTTSDTPAPDASGGRPGGNLIRLTSDADGRFAHTLPSAAKCDVRLSPLGHPAFEPKRDDVRHVVPPAEGIEFVVDRKPTATLVVTAFDADEAKPLAQPTCTFGRRIVRQTPAADGSVEALVRLDSAAGDTVKVTVAAGGASAERDVAVRDGERVAVRVDVVRGAEIRGRVVDAAARPVVNALAFFGEEDVARGDEPFKPFDEKRVREGARTDADGRFALRGAGRWVTIWHADAGPVTVARGDAASVVLPARGSVRGVLRTQGGAPDAGKKVFLDRVRETTTDAEGRFEFTGVEPGTRGLSLTGGKPKAYVAVRVAAGAATDVELRPGLPSVRITWPGRTSLGRFVGIVPLDAVGSLAYAQSEGGAVVLADVLPGRYLVLDEGGAVAPVEIAGITAEAVVGTGEVVVHAKPGARLYVVPAGAGYLARLLAGRQAGASVASDGVKRFTGLAPGRYEVGVEREGVRTTVEVTDGTVETTID